VRQSHAQRTGMLGLALLVGTGTECAGAAPGLDKMKIDEAEKRHQFAQHIEGAYGTRYAEAAQRVAENQGGEVIYQEYKDGKLTYEVTAPPAQIRALGMPPVMLVRPLDCPDAPRPPAKPRSKSGQRRAHARWGR